MIYKQINIKTNEEAIEEITGILLSFGIDRCSIVSPTVAREILDKKESYEWDYVEESAFNNEETIITFYLENTDEANKIIDDISESLSALQSKNDEMVKFVEIEMLEVSDEDWMNSYKDHFKTIKLTDTIVIKPSWEKMPTDENLKVVELDPGMAFGTGSHETTSMCIKLMEILDCADKDVLDIGTGSGILAIVADLLGADDVLGIDIDETAVEVAKENAQKNNCKDNVQFMQGDLADGLDFKADIVVANLMAELVAKLSKSVIYHMKKDAYFVSSGILAEKEKLVVDAITSNGMQVIDIMRDGEWIAIVAKK